MSDLLHYEDFSVGQSWELGTYQVTADEIKSFAREFDPQFFHLDEDRARSSVLGGLSASGWHTCGMLMRLMVDGYLYRTAAMGSPGLDEVKWLKPVYAGEKLLGRMTVLAKRQSKSRPDMGLVTMRWEAQTTKGETKIDMTGINLIKVRAP
jgi:acyl dehydratase